MTSVGQITQQLQQDIQNELVTANQLLRSIYMELQQIRYFTESGGEFETTIKENATLMTTFSDLLNIDLKNVTPFVRNYKNLNIQSTQNITEVQSSKNESAMEETR